MCYKWLAFFFILPYKKIGSVIFNLFPIELKSYYLFFYIKSRIA